MRNLCRTLSQSLCAAMLAVGALTFADADAGSIRYDLNIPSEDLTAALQSFAIASHHKLLYKAELTAGKTSRALKGQFTAEEAIEALLSGTGLTFQITGSSVILIRDQNGASTDALRKESAAPGASENQSSEDSPAKEGKNNSSGNFRVAQVDQGKNSNAPSVGSSAEQSSSTGEYRGQLEEIVVTAQKREERLQDVPVPVTALSASALLDANEVRIQDFYTQVPGLSVTPDDLLGTSRITIRGISTGGFSNPTVGVVVDDVPYGSSTGLGYGYTAPDIDPGDLARIEVLRGPQGTLYGADAMGGLLKYVTVDPSTDRLGGRVQADINTVFNGGKPGYGFRGSMNVPLSDTLAIRASAFIREDPGYIDDPVLNLSAVNAVKVYGGRLAGLWRPSEDFSLKVSALFQERKAYGQSLVEPTLGDLKQSLARNSGDYDKQIQVYSATVAAKVGIFSIASITGLSINEDNYWFDLTPCSAHTRNSSSESTERLHWTKLRRLSLLKKFERLRRLGRGWIAGRRFL